MQEINRNVKQVALDLEGIWKFGATKHEITFLKSQSMIASILYIDP